MKKLKLDLSACQGFWAVAKPYWWGSQERWKAIGLLLFMMLLLILQAKMNVLQNGQKGEFTSALAEQNAGRFWPAVLTYLVACMLLTTLQTFRQYLQDKICWFWRGWLTNFYLQKYMKNRNFYWLFSWKEKIDNPDQRISQDIEKFCYMSLDLFMHFSSSLVSIIAFGVVLWSISHNLVIVLILYAGVGILITTVGFGRILIPLKTEQLKREANFRFGLVRIRENAESIAFYGGDNQELNNVKQIFRGVLSNLNQLISCERNLRFFSSVYQVITWIFPAVILGPRILSGENEVGILIEAKGAFNIVFTSLIVLVREFGDITHLVAGLERLESLKKVLEEPKASPIDGKTTIDTIEDSSLSLEHMTLQTPNYHRTLVKDVSIEILLGERLLIVGVSGCGKSSILRAIAGLWNSGTGTIHRPKLGEILFLPQRPYMILGSLCDQLLYPSTNVNISELEIYQVLKQVNLPELAERFGGLDAIEDWDHVLSIGEQQRVAFARLLLTHPRYAILDEATSALDVKNEQSLYSHLQKLSTIYISVGHRPTLLKYHDKVLEVHDDETWRVISAENYNFMSMN